MTEEFYDALLEVYRTATTWNDAHGGSDVSWALERSVRAFMRENPRPSSQEKANT